MSANPYEPPGTPVGTRSREDFPDVTSVTYTLTAEEVTRARAALVTPMNQGFTPAIVTICIMGVCAVLALIPTSIVSSGLAFVLFIFIPLFLVFQFVNWLRPRELEPAPERTVEIRRDGIVTREEGSFELSRPWAAIDEIKDNGREIIFVVKGYNYARRKRTRIDALPVPRLAFPAPGAADSFLRVARDFWAREHPSK